MDARFGPAKLPEKGGLKSTERRNSISSNSLSEKKPAKLPRTKSWPSRFSDKADSRISNIFVCGLTNLGNTCYMNSTLQCLYHTIPLRKYFLKQTQDLEKQTISTHFQNCLSSMSQARCNASDLFKLKRTIGEVVPRFLSRNQEDAQELLTFLLDGLHESENEIKVKPYVKMAVEDQEQPEEKIAQIWWERHLKRNKSEIVALFHGQVRVQTICLSNTSHKDLMFEPISQLTLPLPKVEDQLCVPGHSMQLGKHTRGISHLEETKEDGSDQLEKKSKSTEMRDIQTCFQSNEFRPDEKFRHSTPAETMDGIERSGKPSWLESRTPFEKEMFTLHDCLELYTREKTSLDHQWFCKQCNDVVKSTRKTELWKMPKILVIHLKRFTANRYRHSKRQSMVKFDFVLHLDKFMAEKSMDRKGTVYDLYAVINHFGELHFGHYTAFIRCEPDHSWYCCDDSHVCEIKCTEVQTKNAYILFYQKRESLVEDHAFTDSGMQ